MRKSAFAVVLMAVMLSMTACGRQLSGTYVSTKGAMVPLEIEFKSGNKVNFTTNIIGLSSTREMDYEINGKELVLKGGRGNMIAKITDNGCLDFGSGLGKVCKEVPHPPLSGTYSLPTESRAAKDFGIRLQIEFKSKNKVQWTFFNPQHGLQGSIPLQQNSLELPYEIHGDDVAFKFPNGKIEIAQITDEGCLTFVMPHPSTPAMKVCKLAGK